MTGKGLGRHLVSSMVAYARRRGYDTEDAKRDPACVLPLRVLRDLAAGGEIGGLVSCALSFMGGIYSQRLVRDEVGPRFRDFVLREQADLVLLVPV